MENLYDTETLFNNYTWYQLENKELFYIAVNKQTNNELKGSLKHILNLIKTENKLYIEYKDLNKSFEGFLDKNIIYDISFNPILNKTFERNTKLYYNTFKTNEYLFISNSQNLQIDYLKSNCPLIYELLNNLCSNEEYKLNYLLIYLSFRLRFPFKRAQKLFNLYGNEASGKGLFYDKILKPLFHYTNLINKNSLDLPYDNYKKECLILFVDEIEHKEEYENKLKSMLTSDFQILNTKKDTLQEEPLFFDCFATTNKRFTLNAGERRGIYFKSKTLRGSKDEAQKFFYEFLKNYDKEFSNFVLYLQSQELTQETEEYLLKGLDTEEAKEQREILKTMEDLFVERIIELGSLDNISHEYFESVNSLNKYLLKPNYVLSKFFLDCYNNYRKQIDTKLTKQIQMNRFSWFWEELKLKNDIERLKHNNKLDFYISLNKLKCCHNLISYNEPDEELSKIKIINMLEGFKND